MIDNIIQVERLLPRLQAALPLPARLTPEATALLRAQSGFAAIGATCTINHITYLGDEGGIMCSLDFGETVQNQAHTSITHLCFDARLPLSREITAYQRHRIKRIHRQS